MRDGIENWDALLMRLKHSLQALAMPADTQFELFPDFVCKADELALVFDHWSGCVLGIGSGELSEEQKSLLKRLGGAFDSMGGGERQTFWTEDALRNSLEWQGVRDVANVALASFGWDAERPPSYKDEYVPGANI